MLYPRRAKKAIVYHSRTGKPIIHQASNGGLYIMVRKRGGGVKRLFEGSLYTENGRVVRLNLKGA